MLIWYRIFCKKCSNPLEESVGEPGNFFNTSPGFDHEWNFGQAKNDARKICVFGQTPPLSIPITILTCDSLLKSWRVMMVFSRFSTLNCSLVNDVLTQIWHSKNTNLVYSLHCICLHLLCCMVILKASYDVLITTFPSQLFPSCHSDHSYCRGCVGIWYPRPSSVLNWCSGPLQCLEINRRYKVVIIFHFIRWINARLQFCHFTFEDVNCHIFPIYILFRSFISVWVRKIPFMLEVSKLRNYSKLVFTTFRRSSYRLTSVWILIESLQALFSFLDIGLLVSILLPVAAFLNFSVISTPSEWLFLSCGFALGLATASCHLHFAWLVCYNIVCASSASSRFFIVKAFGGSRTVITIECHCTSTHA